MSRPDIKKHIFNGLDRFRKKPQEFSSVEDLTTHYGLWAKNLRAKVLSSKESETWNGDAAVGEITRTALPDSVRNIISDYMVGLESLNYMFPGEIRLHLRENPTC